MKISFDAKRLFNNFTGLGNYSRTLVTNLQKDFPDNQYTLYTPRTRNNPDTEYFFESTKFRIVLPDGVLKSLWRSFTIKFTIQRDKPDIFHGLSHDLPFTVSRFHGTTKYVVTIHDVCYKTFPSMFPRIERLIYGLKYGHSLRIADKIVAISESTKIDILKYFPRTDPAKIEVIYQALNPVYYDQIDIRQARDVVESHGVKGDFILYVGSINSRKNLLGVVQAYSLLPENKRLPLVVIGSGSGYKDTVVDYARRNNILQYLNFIDNITLPENLKSFYTAARMLVYPSFYEGFGLPVAEALLCGTAVITSSVSSLPEAAGPGALYIDPARSEEIAAAIERLLDTPELAAEIAAMGREYVIDHFDPMRLTDQMMQLYNSIYNEK